MKDERFDTRRVNRRNRWGGTYRGQQVVNRPMIGGHGPRAWRSLEEVPAWGLERVIARRKLEGEEEDIPKWMARRNWCH